MTTEASGSYHPGDHISHIWTSLIDQSKLDTLSIQTRAIERALPLSPEFAAQLFEEVTLKEDRASCKEANVEDVSAFYLTAAKIIEDKRITSVFGEDKNTYPLTLAANMRVPAEIAPLANLIANTSIPSDILSQTERAFNSSLNRITASDREMTAAEEGGKLTEAIKLLADKLTRSDIPSRRLLAAYRDFLVRSLTPESCMDHSLDRTETAQRFNSILPGSQQGSDDLGPFTSAQLKPESQGDSAPYWIDSLDTKMIEKMGRITLAQQTRIAEGNNEGQAGGVATVSPDADDVIRYAVSLEPTECPVCDFRMKGFTMMLLTDTLPLGPQLEKAVNAEVEYLSFHPMQKDDPVSWLTLLKDLINISRKSKDGAKEALDAMAKKGRMSVGQPSANAAGIRKTLRASSDPIISAYMSVGDLLNLPFQTNEQRFNTR